MAQFTSQGRLKLLFNGETVSSLMVQTHKRRASCKGSSSYSSARFHYASSSYLRSKVKCCNAEARSSDGVHDEYEYVFEYDSVDEDVDDDDVFEGDGLSCFRGLVLDISYSHQYSRLLLSCLLMVLTAIIMLQASQCCMLETCHLFRVYGEGLYAPCACTFKTDTKTVSQQEHLTLSFFLNKCVSSYGFGFCFIQADVLEYYDKTVNSPSGSFYIPAVLRVRHLLQVIKRRRVVKNSLSRKNILFRDNYTCQYCSSHENLTIDHVVPAALGGEWTWENLVTACVKCNSKKGRKSLEEAKMKLMKVPKKPKDYDILAIPLTAAALRVLTAKKGTPDEWRQYLSSSVEP